MTKWAHIDPFADDDPAVGRMREALELRPPEKEPAPAAPVPPDPRQAVADLTQRVRAGDRSAIGRLRDLLHRDA